MFVIFQFVSRGSKHDGKAFGSVWGVRVVAGDHDVNKCVCVIIYVCTTCHVWCESKEHS